MTKEIKQNVLTYLVFVFIAIVGIAYGKTLIDGLLLRTIRTRPLERFKLALADDGQILVDKGVAFRLEKGDVDKPGAFLPFA